MAMPNDLVLVRHGESEGNVANARSRRGDERAFTAAFRERPCSDWRLTKLGIEQAKAAGDWIRRNIGEGFDRYYVSDYIRAKETARNLGLFGARWYEEQYLHEREWGELDPLTHQERMDRYADNLARREIDPFYWRPPGGESMTEVCLRVDRILATLHRECAGQKVLIVAHGEVMRAFQIRLERLTPKKYRRLHLSGYSPDRIHNGQIMQYSRVDPVTGEVHPYPSWVRSVCSWNEALSRNLWWPIERRSYSDSDLALEIEDYPRLAE